MSQHLNIYYLGFFKVSCRDIMKNKAHRHAQVVSHSSKRETSLHEKKNSFNKTAIFKSITLEHVAVFSSNVC